LIYALKKIFIKIYYNDIHLKINTIPVNIHMQDL